MDREPLVPEWVVPRRTAEHVAQRAQAPLRELQPGGHIHLVGVAGAGMVALAAVLLERGFTLSGSDQQISAAVLRLAERGLAFHQGHDAALVQGADLLIISAAVRETNPELVAARQSGIPVVKRAAALGWLLAPLRTIAVAGTAGKTTTSAMAAVALHHAGLDPTFVVGAEVLDLGASAAWGGGPWAVVEADEYDHSFLQLQPDVAVITNVEPDHLEYFGSLEAMYGAYLGFVARIRPGGSLVINADDPYLRAMPVPGDITVVRCGTQEAAPAGWLLRDVEDGPAGLRFGLRWNMGEGAGEMEMRLVLSGLHNARNAMQACAAAALTGIPPHTVGAALERFRGTSRRFQTVGLAAGVQVIDDYAHHPTKVRATLAAARSRFPGRRIVAVFQPHTYSRTRLLFDDFVAAFDGADLVAITEIYAARETDTLGMDAGQLREALERRRPGSTVGAVPALPAILAALVPLLRPGDVVVIMGAGTITEAGPRLLAALRDGEGE